MDETLEHRLYQGKTAYLTRIFSRWRILYIIIPILSLFSLLLMFLEFILFDQKFYPHCALYATLSFAKVSHLNVTHSYYVIEEGDKVNPVSKWGPDAACNAFMGIIIVSIIVATAWLIIFASLRSYSPNFQEKLTPLVCICGFLVTSFTFAGAIVLTRGGSTFCESFRGTDLNCKTAQHVNWINYPAMHKFYDYLLGCQISIWITSGIFYLSSLVVLFRWVTDVDEVIADERERDDRDRFSRISRPISSRRNESSTQTETQIEE